VKLNLLERLITNSPLRALEQRLIEAPLLKSMASRGDYPLCLEIGCGRGAGAAIIAREFHASRVVAVDIDEEQIMRARKSIAPELADIVSFGVGDAMALAEPDDTFDAVFSFGVLHHMEDWRAALAEVTRVLKPGGELFFMELLRAFLGNALIARLTEHPPGGMFTFEEFSDGLRSEGLELTAHKRIGGLLVLGVGIKRERAA
jgi:ubiquinone/menaquinone biosynthesis C-methylase UbiE